MRYEADEDRRLAGGLNPCYIGICSVRGDRYYKNLDFSKRLNPCYSGICSVRMYNDGWFIVECVLILVIVEYAL